MRKVIIGIKAVLAIVMYVAYTFFKNYFDLIVGNSLSVSQLDGTAESVLFLRTWNTFTNIAPILLIVLMILLFFKEIELIVTKIKKTEES